LAWDGTGSSNCFDGNKISGTTGPPGLESAYPCSGRPFPGTVFDPVTQAVDAAVAAGLAGRGRNRPSRIARVASGERPAAIGEPRGLLGLGVHGDVAAALGRERLPRPRRVSLSQTKPGDAGHQIQLGGPRVPQ
jgi:hypothetical protein